MCVCVYKENSFSVCVAFDLMSRACLSSDDLVFISVNIEVNKVEVFLEKAIVNRTVRS